MSIEKAYWTNYEPHAMDVELVQEKLALAAQLTVNLRSYALDGAPEPVVLAEQATRISGIMQEIAKLASVKGLDYSSPLKGDNPCKW